MNDKALRKTVIEFVRGGSAHVSSEAALQKVNPKLRHVRPADAAHSVWEELEHIRIAQEDILRYTLDANWQSPDWPAGYWPAPVTEVTDEMWEESVRRFTSDLNDLIELAADEDRDCCRAESLHAIRQKSLPRSTAARRTAWWPTRCAQPG